MSSTQHALPSLPARYYEVCDAIACYVEQSGNAASLGPRRADDSSAEGDDKVGQSATASWTASEEAPEHHTLPTTPSSAVVRCVEASRHPRRKADASHTRGRAAPRARHAAAAEPTPAQTFDMEAAYRAMRERVERDVLRGQTTPPTTEFVAM